MYTIGIIAIAYFLFEVFKIGELSAQKKIIAAFVAGYAKLRDWPSNNDHRKAISEALEPYLKADIIDEIEEVKELIDVNENKLALETVCAIFYEEKKMVTQEQLELIKSIGKNMTISPQKWERLGVLKLLTW